MTISALNLPSAEEDIQFFQQLSNIHNGWPSTVGREAQQQKQTTATVKMM